MEMEQNEMISYELVITCRTHNPKFQDEMIEYNARVREQDERRRSSHYGNSSEESISIPRVYSEQVSLNVVLSPEQFEIIKANVMKEWK